MIRRDICRLKFSPPMSQMIKKYIRLDFLGLSLLVTPVAAYFLNKKRADLTADSSSSRCASSRAWCRLSLLTNSALVYRVQMRGGGGGICGVSANECSCANHVTWSPKYVNFGDLPPYLTYDDDILPNITNAYVVSCFRFNNGLFQLLHTQRICGFLIV